MLTGPCQFAPSKWSSCWFHACPMSEGPVNGFRYATYTAPFESAAIRGKLISGAFEFAAVALAPRFVAIVVSGSFLEALLDAAVSVSISCKFPGATIGRDPWKHFTCNVWSW